MSLRSLAATTLGLQAYSPAITSGFLLITRVWNQVLMLEQKVLLAADAFLKPKIWSSICSVPSALFTWETSNGVQCPKAFQICIPDFIINLTFHIFMATSSPEILFMDLFRVILWISLFHCWVPHSLALEQHPDVPGKVCERRKSKLRSVLDLTDLILQRRVQCILLVQRDYTYETTILHHPQKTLLICT